MTNLNSHLKSIAINISKPKRDLTKQPTYWKEKNKAYYQATKEKRKQDDDTSKRSLINHYKKKLGEETVLYLVGTLGLFNAIQQMKKIKKSTA